MSKRRLLLLASVVFIVIVVVVSTILLRHPSPQESIVTFTGKVTAIGNGCSSDGTCFITIDGDKTIITGCGLMAHGQTCAPYNQDQLQVGDRIQATVVKTDKTFSLGTVNPSDQGPGVSCPECKITKL